MKETRLGFCNICDNSINIENKSKHIKSKTHKHNEKFSVVVEKYEFFTPDINKIDSIINSCAGDCFKKHFHTCKIRCVYDIEMTNDDFDTVVTFDKKLEKIARQNGFTQKLTIKICSSLSNINNCYFLKF